LKRIKLLSKIDGIARFHFAPNIDQDKILNILMLEKNTFEIKDYSFSPKFNTKNNALVLEIKFQDYLKIEIKI